MMEWDRWDELEERLQDRNRADALKTRCEEQFEDAYYTWKQLQHATKLAPYPVNRVAFVADILRKVVDRGLTA